MELKYKSLAVLVIILLLGACANNKIANNETFELQARERAATATMTPEQALADARQKINQAQSEGLSVYAPLHLKAAREALDKAQQAKNLAEPASLVLEKSFQATTLLEAAFAMKARVKNILKPSIEHLSILNGLNTAVTLPKKYRAVERKLQYLIKDIEGGFIEDAKKGQRSLLSYMSKVEIDTLKAQHLGPAKQQLEQAKDVEAGEYAPQTFALAKQMIKQSSMFIDTHYRDRDGVKQAGLKALYAAQHAYQLAQAAKPLVALSAKRAEEQALAFEALLEQINTEVGIRQLNTHGLKLQAKLLADMIRKTREPSSYAVPVEPGLKIEVQGAAEK